MSVAKRLLISGRVQGVFYRATTRDEAHELGLRGWVRNLPDGRVEAWVQGDAPLVDRLVAWCRQGPPYAEVTEVEVLDVQPDPSLEGRPFGVRY